MAHVPAVIAVAATLVPGAQPRLDALLDFCGSPTLARARETAAAWGWKAGDPARIAEWRKTYEKAIGAPVEGAVWTASADTKTDQLAFWSQSSGGRYHACSFATRRPNDLREAIEARFGSPAQADDLGAGAGVASWSTGSVEVSWSRVGDVTLVDVVHRP